MSLVPQGAVSLMYQLVLESGDLWGDVAIDQQIRDVEAIFGPGPNKHFLTRPRGGSKTTDIGGIAVSFLAVEAPPRARGYVVASNADQAAELVDAAGTLIANTPALEGIVAVENEKILGPNDAWVRVLPQSEAGAWGRRNTHLLICDEFCQWPDTRGAKRVWTAVRSTVQKTPGCQLIILSSSGEPAHWSRKIYEAALKDPKGWRVSDMPGPVPWQSAEEIEALRRELTPSEFERLILNRWSQSEDYAIPEEDYLAAANGQWVKAGRAPLGIKGYGARLYQPRSGVRYIETIDVGTRNDATVLCISHKEPVSDPRGPQRLVVDHLERWQGSKKCHVQIENIEARAAELAFEYNRASIYGDPDQFVGSLQSLRRRGLKAEEWRFGPTSVGQLATALVQTFRNSLIEVPDTEELKVEILRVRLRETAPGVTRLDHDRNDHDDQAVVIGMACHILLGNLKQSAAEWIATVRTAGSPEAREAAKERQAARAEHRAHRQEDDALERAQRFVAARRRVRPEEKCSHRWRPEPPHKCAYGCGAQLDAS